MARPATDPSKGIDLRKHIRDIPDWPKKGILFRDITTAALIDLLSEQDDA